MSTRAKAQWLTAGIIITLAGVVFASGQWQAEVDAALCGQGEHIDLHCDKIDDLELRAAELQALYYEHRARIETLEVRVDTLYARSSVVTQVTLDLYEAVTGEDWNP